jgi:hypothetical protein
MYLVLYSDWLRGRPSTHTNSRTNQHTNPHIRFGAHPISSTIRIVAYFLSSAHKYTKIQIVCGFKHGFVREIALYCTCRQSIFLSYRQSYPHPICSKSYGKSFTFRVRLSCLQATETPRTYFSIIPTKFVLKSYLDD